MNNWINRLALIAIVGAALSSAVLVGCGNSADTTDTNAAMNAPAGGPAADANEAG